MTLEKILNNLDNKQSNFYFYVPSLYDKPMASVSFIYDMVYIMRNNGYMATIIHDKDYKTPMWMGGKYHTLPHKPLTKLKLNAYDFMFIPELFCQAFHDDLKQNKIKIPCQIVAIAQNYKHILQKMDYPNDWRKFGIRQAITTSVAQKDYIESIMPSIETFVVNPAISDVFRPTDKPRKPIVMIFSRDPVESNRFVNEFYRKNRHMSWIPFRIVNKITRKELASVLREACVSVWIDKDASFGTFPLESMKSGIPVIGVVPSRIPEWMGEKMDGKYKVRDNGKWVLSEDALGDVLGNYMTQWMLDTEGKVIYDNMKEYADKYTLDDKEKQLLPIIDTLIERRKEFVKQVFDKKNKNTKENA